MYPELLASSVDSAAVVAEARKWLGVNFAHQGRSEYAVDCAGLVIKVAHALNLSDFDFTNYARRPDGITLEALCDQHMTRRWDKAPEAGLVALIRFGKLPQHLAIIGQHDIPGEFTLIHAHNGAGAVVEHILDLPWRKRIVALYSLPGVC